MDIPGIGNAVLDIFWFSDDESALTLGLHPNNATHVSPERLDELLLAVPSPILVSGGSASNSVKAAAALGVTCAFIGCTGIDDRESDRWAKIFSADLSSFGVRCILENRNAPTGRCLVIQMPGDMKSIACSPGAAPALHPEQIPAELIVQSKVVLLDGQTLRNAEASGKITEICREHGIPLAIDAGSSEIIRDFSEVILDILVHNDCILFVNDSEALTLALALERVVPGDLGIQSPDGFIHSVFSFFTAHKRFYPCIVRKMGPNGACAWNAGLTHEAGTTAIPHPLDDTGAGDVFNGSFLAAWIRHKTIQEALEFANAAAYQALMVPGSRLEWDRFAALKGELQLRQASEDS